MNACKYFDLDSRGESICRLGGTCDFPERCTNKVVEEKD